MLNELSIIKKGKTGRFSSWDTTGRNTDSWCIGPGESRVLADINGPGAITHIWMTQTKHYRECLLKFTWDNAKKPSVVVPLGDFFCLGHSIVNSFQSFLFTNLLRLFFSATIFFFWGRNVFRGPICGPRISSNST